MNINNLPPIYFYISNFNWLSENMPESADKYYSNLVEHGICDGEYCWTLQTYLYLKKANFPCQLVGKMPEEGIVLVHRNTLPFNFKPSAKLLVICLKADKPARPYAQLHVVQNILETEKLKPSYYIPHWPQPGLIKRNPQRGDRFENVAFFGTGGNLSPELLTQSWRDRLEKIGLQWLFKNRQQWNDFSDVDAVVAVRKFDEENSGKWKPPTKLYNSWHAGVPAILAPEPAYREQKKSELDYIEVNSIEEIITALIRLRDEPKLRDQTIANAKIRSQETTIEKLVEYWGNFLINIAVPAYQDWRNSSEFNRQIFLGSKYLNVKYKAARRRLEGLISINTNSI